MPEDDVRLGLAQEAAEKISDLAARPADAAHDPRGVRRHRPRDLCAAPHRAQVRVAIVRARQPALVQEIEERGGELRALRRAQPDGAGEAVLERHAVVSPAGRQVEQVARLHHPFVRGAKTAQNSQRCALDERQIALRADAPAARALQLKQEDVIAVEMRTDAAAYGRVAHHDIVESRAGNETETLEQIADGGQHAVDALHDGGRLAITTGRAEGVTIIQIADTGMGFAATPEKLFEPFFTTKPTGKGTGLGLLVSQKIVQEHGGTISVDSKLGKGSTFTIRLPRKHQQD